MCFTLPYLPSLPLSPFLFVWSSPFLHLSISYSLSLPPFLSLSVLLSLSPPLCLSSTYPAIFSQIFPGLILSDIKPAKRMRFKTVCCLLVQLMHCRKMFKAEIPFSNVLTCDDDDKVCVWLHISMSACERICKCVCEYVFMCKGLNKKNGFCH